MQPEHGVPIVETSHLTRRSWQRLQAMRLRGFLTRAVDGGEVVLGGMLVDIWRKDAKA